MHRVTKIPCGNANCFCLEENGSAILIDTSRVAYRQRIYDACKDKNMRLIVLTHGHVDHIQNAAALGEMLNAPIAMHAADAELIANNLAQPMSAHTLLGKLVLALTMKNFEDAIEPFVPSVLLKDGDTLEEYGISAKVLGLPGHTKGSIGVLAGGKDFFVGDALFHLLYPTKSMLYGDKAEMERSAGKISTYSSAVIHFGHGKSVPNKNW